jgi:UDPglucose 6-dehydrogenase
MVDKIRQAAGDSLTGATVAMWGLTFKANTDDLRDSPALAIAAQLIASGATVRAYDPAGGEAAERLVPGLGVSSDPYDVCDGADALLVVTEWDEFRWLDFDRVAGLMRNRSVVDARNLLDPAAMRHRGFEYQGVGR